MSASIKQKKRGMEKKRVNIEANKALVRRYLELWQTGNLVLADEVLAPEYIDHTRPHRLPGPEPVKQEVISCHAC